MVREQTRDVEMMDESGEMWIVERCCEEVKGGEKQC